MKVTKIILLTIILLFQLIISQGNCPNYPYNANLVSTSNDFTIGCSDWYFLYSGEGKIEFKANGTNIIVGVFSSKLEYAFKFTNSAVNIHTNQDLSNGLIASFPISLNPMMLNRFKIVFEKHNSAFKVFLNGILVGEQQDFNWKNDLIQYSLAKFSDNKVVYFRNDPYIDNFPGYPYSPKNQSWDFYRNDFSNNNGIQKIHSRAKGSGLIIGIFSGEINDSSKFNYAISFGQDKSVKLYQDGNLTNIINSVSKSIDYESFFNKYTIILDQANLKISVLINGINQVDFTVSNIKGFVASFYSFRQLSTNVIIDNFLECKQPLPYNPLRGVSDGKDWNCFNLDWNIPTGDIRELNLYVYGYDYYIGIFDDNRIYTKNFNLFFIFGGWDNQKYRVFKDGDVSNILINQNLTVYPTNTYHKIKIQFDLNMSLINLFYDGDKQFSDKLPNDFSFTRNTPLYYSFSQNFDISIFTPSLSKKLPESFPYNPKTYWSNRNCEFFNDIWTLQKKGSGEVNFKAKGYDFYLMMYDEEKIFTPNFDILIAIGGWVNKFSVVFQFGRINEEIEKKSHSIPDPNVYNDYKYIFDQVNANIKIYINQELALTYSLKKWPDKIKYFSFSQNSNTVLISNITSS